MIYDRSALSLFSSLQRKLSMECVTNKVKLKARSKETRVEMKFDFVPAKRAKLKAASWLSNLGMAGRWKSQGKVLDNLREKSVDW